MDPFPVSRPLNSCHPWDNSLSFPLWLDKFALNRLIPSIHYLGVELRISFVFSYFCYKAIITFGYSLLFSNPLVHFQCSVTFPTAFFLDISRLRQFPTSHPSLALSRIPCITYDRWQRPCRITSFNFLWKMSISFSSNHWGKLCLFLSQVWSHPVVLTVFSSTFRSPILT